LGEILDEMTVPDSCGDHGSDDVTGLDERVVGCGRHGARVSVRSR